MSDLEGWEDSVGEVPFKVTVFENLTRGGVLYLKWRAVDRSGNKNWAVESLRKTVRTANGRLIESVRDWAVARAKEKHEELVAGLPASERSSVPMTLLEGLERACDAETGLYPKDSPHRREVRRELHHASRILGPRLPFNLIRKSHLVKLWRRRHSELTAKGEVGARGAEVTVSRLLTIAEWLRGEEWIDEAACKAWKDWKAKMREEAGAPDPYRPRHTLAEARAILAVADQVDPRLGLALALGAEQRGGQVIRGRRSDLDLEANTFQVRGRGKKKGTTVHLTRGQRAAVDRALAGYLAQLEAAAIDYPLFPAGKLHGREAQGGVRVVGRRELKGKAIPTRVGHRLVATGPLVAPVDRAETGPLDRSSIDDWFLAAEALAGVEHVPGRSWYGLRRALLDAAAEEGISPEGMQEHGGWSDIQVPQQIYRDKERRKARDEARDVRAKNRGEEGE